MALTPSQQAWLDTLSPQNQRALLTQDGTSLNPEGLRVYNTMTSQSDSWSRNLSPAESAVFLDDRGNITPAGERQRRRTQQEEQRNLRREQVESNRIDRQLNNTSARRIRAFQAWLEENPEMRDREDAWETWHLNDPVAAEIDAEESTASRIGRTAAGAGVTALGIGAMANQARGAFRGESMPQEEIMARDIARLGQTAARQRADAERARMIWERDERVPASMRAEAAAAQASQAVGEELGAQAGAGAAIERARAAERARRQEFATALPQERQRRFDYEQQMLGREDVASDTERVQNAVALEQQRTRREYLDMLRMRRVRENMQQQASLEAGMGRLMTSPQGFNPNMGRPPPAGTAPGETAPIGEEETIEGEEMTVSAPPSTEISVTPAPVNVPLNAGQPVPVGTAFVYFSPEEAGTIFTPREGRNINTALGIRIRAEDLPLLSAGTPITIPTIRRNEQGQFVFGAGLGTGTPLTLTEAEVNGLNTRGTRDVTDVPSDKRVKEKTTPVVSDEDMKILNKAMRQRRYG